jgi:hypothetical protein
VKEAPRKVPGKVRTELIPMGQSVREKEGQEWRGTGSIWKLRDHATTEAAIYGTLL